MTRQLTVPLEEEAVRALRVGDVVSLTGRLFTMRDMAHLRYRELLQSGQQPPRDLAGGVVFHAGPVASREEGGGWRLHVVGPTTSIRMEPYADMVGALGVRALIGKGGMGPGTEQAAREHGYVYLQAAPGCAAKLAEGIAAIHSVTWLELGMPEAVWELEARDFGPLIVGIDAQGRSLYSSLRARAHEILDRLYPE